MATRRGRRVTIASLATVALFAGGIGIAVPSEAATPNRAPQMTPLDDVLYQLLTPVGLEDLAVPGCISLLIAEIDGYHDGCASA